MELSKRLSAVAELVTPGGRIADIGTDHGYIPIWLMLEQKISGAVAMDVRRGPLERAKAHIAEYHLEKYIEVRLSDGLAKLKSGEADTIVIAGMGGPLMARILQEGQEVLSSVKELVLQPQSDIGEFRHRLHVLGYEIVCENMIFEDGKFYPMMKAVPAVQTESSMDSYREIEYQYGHFLLKEKNPVLNDYLHKEQETVSSILKRLENEGTQTTSTMKRIQELEERLSGISEALDEMQ